MSFLAPVAFVLATLIPIIIAMYLLKLRRTEQVVSSVYLWRRMVRDVEANAPWQRLRRNLLLFLQLIFLAALVLALARPFTWTEGPGGQALIFVVDTSASMAATDAAPNRLEAAKAQALQLVDALPDGARVTIIAAGDSAQVLVASAQDRRQVRIAIESLHAGTGGSDLITALELASAIAARQVETEIVIFSDGRVALPQRLALKGRVRYVPLGTGGDNQAIGIFSLQRTPGGEDLTAFAQVINYSDQTVQRRLDLYAGGQLFNAYDLELAPGGQKTVIADNLPAGTCVVEAQLTGEDVLPLDDHAWAIYRHAAPASVTLVTDGNLFLETVLALMPSLGVTTVRQEELTGRENAGGESNDFQSSTLTILDAYVPVTATIPPGNLLFIAPPRSTEYFSVTGTLDQPTIQAVDADDALLAHVDLSQVSVLEAVRMPLPAWARPILVAEGAEGIIPLLFVGETDGRRIVVLAFDLHRSDLPLQVAFPLLVANLTGWLAPSTGGDLPTRVAPGAAVTVLLPPETESATVTRPDGSKVRVVPEDGRAVFADTMQLGVYSMAWGESEEAPFAVNLFSPQESDVQPAETLPLASANEAGEGAYSRQARREWWRPLAWAALALLMIEWWIYNRGTVARLKGMVKGWMTSRLGTTLQSLNLLFFPFAFVHPGALWLFLLIPLVVALALLGKRRPTRARFWASLALRVLLLTLLILALAGTQWRSRADTLTAVFVLDASDSVPLEEQAHGEALIRQAVEAMPRGDKAAIVVFGQDALVERLASEVRTLPHLTSVPLTARTDVAGALQLALALFPDEGAKRLVLLSDGRENLGHALTQAELAAAHDVELVFVPLGGPEGDIEVRVGALDAPGNVRQGQDFDLVVIVESSAQIGATLRVFGGGRLIHSQVARLQPGSNRFLVPVEADETGFRRFRAQIVPDADTQLQNNEASAFTVVYGPPRVLLVEGQSGEAASLADVLRAAEMDVTVVPPGELPGTLPELAAHDAIVLANVPAVTLPAETMDALQVYVCDLGKGLLMIGGESSFGAGGYLRTSLEETLPVDMDVRTKEQSPNLALVLAVDKSGSMGRCHCDNPDLNQTYERREIGQPKVDIAKEAVMRAASALGPLDYLGVVAFDSDAHWALKLSQLPDPVTLEQAIGRIQAAGQTSLRTGVETAYTALQDADAQIKHVILLTDGWVHTGDLTRLAAEMQEQGITLSVVAAGGGSAEYLEALAQQGGGRYYPAVDVLRVPDFFLKETVKAVGQYIIEEPFFPLPSAPGSMLRGLDPAKLPLLLGYNGTTPKSTARVTLSTPRGDPLLATWQYGLGRAAAWTSDLKGQWAVEWVTWPDFGRFAAQLVGWTLPAPQVEGVVAQASLEEERAALRVVATDETGYPRNFLNVSATLIDPDLETTEVLLTQVAAGRYEALLEVSQPGTYLAQLGIRDGEEVVGQQTLGLVVPYSPEYKASGIDHFFLAELARLTGGAELQDAELAFVHDLPATDRANEIWSTLLLLTALLFPLDVALRRVMLGPQDLRKVTAWLQARLPAFQRRPLRADRALGNLFQVRDRTRARYTRTETQTSTPSMSVRGDTQLPSPVPAEPPSGNSSPLPVPSSDDSLARLRQAKKRARRGH